MVKVVPTISSNVNDKAVLSVSPLKPKSKAQSWIVRCFKDFAANTALHGYSHIVREDASTWERWAWAIIVIIATITSLILLWVSWKWSAETPTTTVIESTHYAVWNIPFPAVTVCSFNKISAKSAMAMATRMKRPSDMTAEHLSRLFPLALHFQGFGNASKREYDELNAVLNMNNVSVLQLTSSLSPSCDDVLHICRWKGTSSRCERLFQRINTTEGVCCSFNYYGLKTNNYHTKISQSRAPKPLRLSACGSQTGLYVLLKPLISDYSTTFFNSYGFRVFIHDAYDFVDENAETKVVSLKMFSLLRIAPENTYSTDDVRALPVAVRQCLMPKERKMNVMHRYSYVNCMAECRSEIVFKLCGCVPYHMLNNGSRPVCGMNQIICAIQNKPIYDSATPNWNRNASLGIKACDCLPDCEFNLYSTEISTSAMNRSFSFSSNAFYKDLNTTDHILVNVFYADLDATHYRKDIFQNWLALLASFGGLLGLLLGFSFVTAFELIYFFTFRVLFDRLSSANES